MSCKYLYVAHRMAISRMRLSIHKFPVEVGRYTQKLQEKKEYVICVRAKALENNFIIAYCKHKDLENLRNNFLSSLYKVF